MTTSRWWTIWWCAGALGLTLLGGLVQVSAGRNGTDARGLIALGTAAATCVVLGALVQRWLPDVAPAALALGALLVVVLEPDILSGDPGAGPLGYSNANAALLVQGVAAAGAVAVGRRSRGVRLAALGLAAGLVVVVVPTRSAAATMLSVGVLAVAASATLLARRARTAAVALPLVVLVALGTTAALGATYDPHATDRPRLQEAAATGLSERRLLLWRDALAIARARPWVGAGPTSFATLSPTALSDRDANHAHSAVLGTAAEAGWPAAGLLVGLLLLGFAGALGPGRDRRVGVVVSAGWAALWLHAGIDYVVSFPAVLLAGCWLLGAGIGARITDGTDSPDRPHDA